MNGMNLVGVRAAGDPFNRRTSLGWIKVWNDDDDDDEFEVESLKDARRGSVVRWRKWIELSRSERRRAAKGGRRRVKAPHTQIRGTFSITLEFQTLSPSCSSTATPNHPLLSPLLIISTPP